MIAVRHGESVSNAAFAVANARGLLDAGLSSSDAEVELTDLGREQATSLGRWLAASPPDVVLSSPYRRTEQTTTLALAELRRLAATAPPWQVDERLRDRELGILELMTKAGIEQRFPQEAARRERVGQFFYRPPAGESMADVALRLRGVLADINRLYGGRRVLLVGHDAVVLILRYLIEDVGHRDVWDLGPVLNASITRWTDTESGLRLAEFNVVPPLPPQ